MPEGRADKKMKYGPFVCASCAYSVMTRTSTLLAMWWG